VLHICRLRAKANIVRQRQQYERQHSIRERSVLRKHRGLSRDERGKSKHGFLQRKLEWEKV
jgi:hypothetical protein